VAVTSNWCRCTSCHAGYGWKDNSFDFSRQSAMDCLVCHDTTGTYKKFPTDCGHPPYKEKVFAGKKVFKPVDLKKVAQNVGLTSRRSCGACHFFSGGGDGVKRGDMNTALLAPSKELDVHMDAKGLNFSCTVCHTTFAHRIDGRNYRTPAPGKAKMALPRDDGHRVRCESCHGNAPHKTVDKLNHHTRRIACETCHVPLYGRGNPTKVWWDWSTAGKFGPGHKIVVEKDEMGKPIYHTKKGSMKWAKDVVPEYFWYNGTISYTLVTDKIPDDQRPIWLNRPLGSPDDPGSKIFPFKVHRGKQPFDPVNRTMVVPKLFGKKGTGAFWAEFDWLKAAAAGMKEAGAPFSGKLEFVETRYHLPLAHMVPPKEQALKCEQCHVRTGGRLAAISGVYIPGRDIFQSVDDTGWIIAGLALAVVALHGAIRFMSAGRKGKKK